MKKPTLICVSVLALTCCMVWAWSGNGLNIARDVPPSLSLSDAYAIAIQARGSYTNEAYCYEASITNETFGGGTWVFKFHPNPESPIYTFIYVPMDSRKVETRIYWGDRLMTNFVSNR